VAANSSRAEFWPSISSDGLCLFFSSWRTPNHGTVDIWVATRDSTAEEFSPPVNLGPVINTPYHDNTPRISADGSVLYYTSHMPGGFGGADMWQASIAPVRRIPDLNEDGIVNFGDFAILGRHWLKVNSAVDISPPPLGDDTIDEKDIIGLAEFWLEETALVAHWKLDETEGVTACDSAGDNDAVLNGSPIWQPAGGYLDGALQFDGIGDYLATPEIINPGQTSLSVLAWVKGDQPGRVVLSQLDGNSFGAVLLGARASDGALMTDPMLTGILPTLESDSVITDGEWRHVALVFDSFAKCRYLYVDGLEVAHDEHETVMMPATGGLHIGARKDLDSGSFWSGMIDDVRVYDVALGAGYIEEIAR